MKADTDRTDPHRTGPLETAEREVRMAAFSVVALLARCHPGLLVLLGASFGLCLMVSLTQFVTGTGTPIGWLVLGVVGLTLCGKSLVLKYAKELAQSKAQQDTLNS
jgi:hypothetical protein